jgi:hypothetical protein
MRTYFGMYCLAVLNKGHFEFAELLKSFEFLV